ncbi:MAG TPA: amidohydrolase family protein [Burkholderiales bacterium]|nr:amidohydrolase family protein [Burkholderiales bacterium]
MLIADAQVHVWAPDTPGRPWKPGAVAHREPPLEAAGLLREMDAAGVRRAVLVPPHHDADRHDLVLAAAREHPDRFAALGRIDTESPPAGIPDGWPAPGMRGLRCTFIRQREVATLVAGRMEPLWSEAEKRGVAVAILVPHAQLPTIGSIAEQHPGLRLTLCHLALTSGEYDDAAFSNLDKLLALAARPSINVNASALPFYTRDGYPYRRLHPYLRRVYDAFGPRRMFWGTDWSRLKCTYRQAVTMFTEEIPWLGARDQEWIMGRGLCEWLRWPTAAST